MRKLLFLAVSAFLLLSSCDNDDNSEPTVLGTWKMTKEMYISGKDNSIFDSTPYSACKSQSNFVFAADNTATFSQYDLNGTTCTLKNSSNFTYSYDSKTKTLTLDANNTQESYVLNSLTDNEMQILTNTDDYNDDGIDDKSVIVFNK
ncbi:lipocalin family protein [Chryseobacterium sp. Bi04]|uniref:lipocalin family protein n=1 Tax=Chryseobacterium sp. Bi04 TaxID=2822345 RepID=UPI001DE235D1|nr:lipocalin family protein [Chryseobacterium sp. Bi04]CAH0164735.1 hypothetical protein SRABI04_01100 [Chryseobacterium sp. Bi04]